MRMVDTNIVIDLREAAGRWCEWSFEAVGEARLAGPVAVSAIVVGELSSRGGSLADLTELMEGFGLRIDEFGAGAAHRAGLAQRMYRKKGGQREKLLGDFLIGGHAEVIGAALITRDARQYRQYFPNLTLITPGNDDD